MNAERSVTLAGIRIAWQPWTDRDPVVAILDCLDPMPADSEAETGQLRIALEVADGEPAPAPSDELQPLFFHGRTRILSSGAAIVFWDGASRLTLSSDGTELVGDVHPDSLADGHTFSHATLLIAIAVSMRLHGRFHLHGGLVSLPGLGTVLVAGDAAHGKSTTTLSLLSRGGLLVGDDTLYIDPTARRIWGLPKPLNLSPRTAATFAALTERVPTPAPAETGKRSYPARTLFPDAVTASLAFPDWLLFPRITDEPVTRLQPLAATDALGGLMTASALVAVDGLDRADEHLSALLAVATAGRAYELLLGRDALERPALIIDLLAAERDARR